MSSSLYTVCELSEGRGSLSLARSLALALFLSLAHSLASSLSRQLARPRMHHDSLLELEFTDGNELLVTELNTRRSTD